MQIPRISTRRQMMAAAVLVAVGLIRADGMAKEDEPFFPDLAFKADRAGNDFIVAWYSEHLKAMKQQSLWKLSQENRSSTVYRLLWLPTFHHPVSVRLDKSSEGAILRAVLLDGRGGYEPGKIADSKNTRLSKQQWDEFQRRLDKAKPWKLPTEKSEIYGLDGDQVILESVMAGTYHIVDRWSPEAGDDYADLCEYMLTLSSLEVMKTWKGYRE